MQTSTRAERSLATAAAVIDREKQFSIKRPRYWRRGRKHPAPQRCETCQGRGWLAVAYPPPDGVMIEACDCGIFKDDSAATQEVVRLAMANLTEGKR